LNLKYCVMDIIQGKLMGIIRLHGSDGKFYLE
jgi:hypothetical protein